MPEVAATGDPTRYREDIPTEEFDGSKYLVKQYFKTHVHIIEYMLDVFKSKYNDVLRGICKDH